MIVIISKMESITKLAFISYFTGGQRYMLRFSFPLLLFFSLGAFMRREALKLTQANHTHETI
jgi:hypothetical protein